MNGKIPPKEYKRLKRFIEKIARFEKENLTKTTKKDKIKK